MSGQWEQYVEKACEAAWDSQLPTQWLDEAGCWQPMPTWAMAGDTDRVNPRDVMRAALAVVAPLIAEDTRTRMVEAAAAAVLRDCETDTIAVAIRKAFAEEIVDFLSRYFPDAHEVGEACEDCAVMHDLARIITERAAS